MIFGTRAMQSLCHVSFFSGRPATCSAGQNWHEKSAWEIGTGFGVNCLRQFLDWRKKLQATTNTDIKPELHILLIFMQAQSITIIIIV